MNILIHILHLAFDCASGNVTYRTDGYLGNFIIVDPTERVVTVRTISHESFRNNNDNFADWETYFEFISINRSDQ